MKAFKNISVTLALLLLFISCNKSWLKETPLNFTSGDVLYTTAEGFEAGINGLYSLVREERNGLNYTGGFGTVDLAATIFLGGTDNIGPGSNTAGLSTIIADWSKSTPADPNLDKVFLWLYRVVNAANTIITRSENEEVNWGSQDRKARVVAEARTIRAWAYRHLTYLWGDVPLMTEERTGENIITDAKRDKVADIRKLMISDFRFAAENLPWLPYKDGRLTRGVAQTYLAETYLAVGKADSALYWANECINSGPYALVTSRYGASASKPGVAFMDMFDPANVNISAGNTEALWVLQWERNALGGGDNLMRHETTMRYNRAKFEKRSGFLADIEERGGRGWSRQTVTKQALLLYYSSSDSAAGLLDDRGSQYAIHKYYVVTPQDDVEGLKNSYTKENWKVGDTVWAATGVERGSIVDAEFKSLSGGHNFNLLPEATRNNNDWPYSLKFAFCDPGFPTTTESHQDQIYMRLAETILIRAEARGRLGDYAGAASDINLLRDRAHAKRVTVADFGAGLNDFLNYILDERSRELLVEEQRRYTLLRMGGQAFFFPRVSKMNTISENLSLRDTLYPIPQSVIDANITTRMEQNPGW
ncbi:MAG: RagB/SusD family nutrient uptake outer membrane protein [Flavisolibacter sp.]